MDELSSGAYGEVNTEIPCISADTHTKLNKNITLERLSLQHESQPEWEPSGWAPADV